MSDKDSATVAAEGGDLPNSQTSQQQLDQPDSSSLPQINPLDLLENKDFVEGLRRVFQSEKDRGVNRVQKEVVEIKDDLAKIADRLGVAPEKVQQVQREIENENIIAWAKEQMVSRQEPQGSGADVSGVIEGILLARQVDKNDPGVREFLANNAGTDAPQKLIAYLNNKPNRPSASPAGVAAPQGSTPVSGDYANLNDDQLGSKLIELQRNYRSNRPEIDKITAELNRRDKR